MSQMDKKFLQVPTDDPHFGRTWSFSGVLSTSSLHDEVLQSEKIAKLMDILAERLAGGMPKSVMFCVVVIHIENFRNTERLLDIPFTGYVQCKNTTRASCIQDWMPFPCDWRLLRGGLRGDGEFEKHMSSAEWVRLDIFEKLLLNNAGRSGAQAARMVSSRTSHLCGRSPLFFARRAATATHDRHTPALAPARDMAG